MSIWNWFKKREPVYSELGERLFRLLIDPNEEWISASYGISHLSTDLHISTGLPVCLVWVGDDQVTEALTEDDRIKLAFWSDMLKKGSSSKASQQTKAERLLTEALDKKGVS